MNQTARQPYRELSESTLNGDKDINEVWLEEHIGKKNDVQTDLQAYIRDMAAARKTRQETKMAQDSELAQIRAFHSRRMMELFDDESEIIKNHPTIKKVKLGVDEVIEALFKTQKEIEQLDQIQQRLYGEEDVDRILKKPQDNMTDRVSGLIQAEKESLQKLCSGFHGQLCYFWSLVSPKIDSTPLDAAYTHRDLPFMDRMAQAMTMTMPETGPLGATEGLLDHTEEPATCDTADEVVQPSAILWNNSDKLVPSRDIRAPLPTRA